jgi:hypothetical protein
VRLNAETVDYFINAVFAVRGDKLFSKVGKGSKSSAFVPAMANKRLITKLKCNENCQYCNIVSIYQKMRVEGTPETPWR